jgi:hypothetical protein
MAKRKVRYACYGYEDVLSCKNKDILIYKHPCKTCDWWEVGSRTSERRGSYSYTKPSHWEPIESEGKK